MARKYRAIGPLLTKMEGLVVHTNTGRSTKLQPYYAYWENAVYEALTKVTQKEFFPFFNSCTRMYINRDFWLIYLLPKMLKNVKLKKIIIYQVMCLK